MFLASAPLRLPTPCRTRELEVIEAMAAILNSDAAGSYDYLYFESDFSAGTHVASSLANPDRTQFCGLTRTQAESLVTELETSARSPWNSTSRRPGRRV